VLDKLVQLRPVHYRWRTVEFPEYQFGAGRNAGLIAQEVEQVFPELVETDARGYKKVNYSELPYLTLAAVGELKTQQEAGLAAAGAEAGSLAAQVQELRRKDEVIVRLRQQVAALQAGQQELAAVLGRMPGARAQLVRTGGKATEQATTGLATRDSRPATALAAMTAPVISGTAGTLGMFTDGTDLGSSTMYQAGASIGINTATPAATFQVMSSSAPGAFFDVYSGTLSALPVVYRAARGTPASPSAVQTDDILGGLAVRGFGATQFSGGRGQVMFRAAENWTDTSQGTYLSMTTTPIGSANYVERLRIVSSGNVGIGTITPAVALQVAGDIRVGTAGTNGCIQNYAGTALAGTCSSDARLKTAIEPFGLVLEKVAQLRPVHYRWRTAEYPEYHFGAARNPGLLAQEVAKVFPELVVTDARGHKMVNYSELPYLTLAALDELKAQQEAGSKTAEGQEQSLAVQVRELQAKDEQIRQLRQQVAALQAGQDELEAVLLQTGDTPAQLLRVSGKQAGKAKKSATQSRQSSAVRLATISPLISSGTAGSLGLFVDGTDLGNSVMYEAGSSIGINTASPAATFHVVSSSTPGAYFDVYSSVLSALPVVYRAARGTMLNPSAVQTDDILGGLAVRGYGATGFSTGRGQVMFRAAENWTDAAQGTYLSLTTTPAGSASYVERMRIVSSGNVGIGTTAPAEALQVIGDVRVGTSGTNGCIQNYAGTALLGTCSSDVRLKTEIEPFGPVLDKLAQLRPVHYQWRVAEFPEYHFGAGRNAGLIAQEVEKVFPELVETDARGYKKVNYSELPYLTLAGVEELKARQDAELSQVQAQQAKLRAQVQQLQASNQELTQLAADIQKLQQHQRRLAALAAGWHARIPSRLAIRL
jgi:ethanolamine utilization microcompartment shell protein EutS/prefoldin subunit 5